jgi:ribosomal protein S18 acetylase RimI-like enzyme
MTAVRIRPAAVTDVPVLASIAAAAYLPYMPRIGRAPAPLTADYAAAVRRGQVWLATSGDQGASTAEALGLIVLVPQPGYLLLENVAVTPSAQGRGVGTALLDFAAAQARELGLPEIRLYTNAAMTENLAYYPRQGYQETGRREEDGFNRVYFTRHLV